MNTTTAFPNKSTETRTKNKLVPANKLQADISIWPVGRSTFGVAVRVAGASMQSKLANDKAEILAFLEKVL